MNELFDFGSRPIRVIEPDDILFPCKFQFVHDKEGWIIAETTQAFAPNTEDEVFNVWDAGHKFMGTVVDFGNLSALVSQIYDQQYRPDATPIKPDRTWVIFGKTTDGEQIATFSREVEAPDLETAKQLVRFELEQVCVDEDISFYAIHGPFSRGSPITYKNLRRR